MTNTATGYYASGDGTYTGAGYAAETTTYAGVDGMAGYELPGFTLSLPNPRAYGGGLYQLGDFNEYPGDTHDVITGENDLRLWFGPTQPLQLSISSSRWEHELMIRHPNGDAYPVEKHQTQGGTYFDPSGAAWQASYYYFDATARHHPELPWYLEDASTAERLGPNPDNDQLINWFALPTPEGLAGSLNAQTGMIELQWPLGSAALDGGFAIERRLSGEAAWQTADAAPSDIRNRLAVHRADRWLAVDPDVPSEGSDAAR